MAKVFRYRLSGFVEVKANSIEEAKEFLKTEHGHQRVFTTYDPKVFTFGYPCELEHIIEES